MKRRCQQRGRQGENLAVAYLEQRGYRVQERNFRCRSGEIDIIAWDKGTLVFLEVKTKGQTAFDVPQAMVDRRKQEKIAQVAVTYVQQRRLRHVDLRFDVIAIMLLPGSPPDITHIQAAFCPPSSLFY